MMFTGGMSEMKSCFDINMSISSVPLNFINEIREKTTQAAQTPHAK
jgi:hypothetical protein